MGTLLDLLMNGNGSHGAQQQTAQTRYALAYLRVSTDDQDEQAQRRDIDRWADSNNAVILDWYADHASKANDDSARAQFWQAVERAKSDKRISLLLVWDESRFYRHKRKAALVKMELEEHGVYVIPVSHPYDPTTIGGMWQETIYETNAEAYSRDVRAKTMKSMPYVFSQRHPDPELNWCYKGGGVPPFGYKPHHVDMGRDRKGRLKHRRLWLLDDRVEAGKPRHEWRRMMALDWYLGEGWGYDQITARLNEYGVKAVRKTFWSANSVRDLFDPISVLTAAGYYIFGRNADKYLGVKGKRRVRDRSEWTIVENAHCPILTLAEAESIEVERQKRAATWDFSKARTKHSEYLLSGGLGRCKACGERLIGYTNHNVRGSKFYYYGCGAWHYHKGEGCTRLWRLPREVVEGIIFDEIERRFPLDATGAEQWAHIYNNHLRREWERESGAHDGLRQEIAKMETQIDNLVNAIAAAPQSNALLTKLTELEAQKERLTARLREEGATKRQPFQPVSVEKVLRNWQRTREALHDGDVTERREKLRLFVREWWLDPDTYTMGAVFSHPLEVCCLLTPDMGNLCLHLGSPDG